MKRSRDMIISEILAICVSGAGKTRIVYEANLNFRTINPYLNLLINNGLIDVKKEHILIYKTTPKGLTLLDDFKQIHSELSSAKALKEGQVVPSELSSLDQQ